MASLLALRPREAGTEISIEHNGREFVLWRAGWWPPDPITPADRDEFIAWATPHVTAILSNEADEAAEDALDETALDAVAFFNWLYSKRNNPQVRQQLKPLARHYRDEVA